MRQADAPTAIAGDDVLKLERSLGEPRTLLSTLLSLGVGVATVSACVPLFSVLIMLVWRGGARLGVSLFTELSPTAFEEGWALATPS